LREDLEWESHRKIRRLSNGVLRPVQPTLFA